MMKLLLVGALPPPIGGDATWAQSFIAHELTQDLHIQTVNTSFIGQRSVNLGKKYILLDEIKRNILILVRVFILLVKFRPQLVHVNCNCSPYGVFRDYLSLIMVKVMGVPTVLHCHANASDAIGGSISGRIIFRWCLGSASQVLVLNQSSYEYCKELAGVNAQILPNFVNEDEVVDTHIIDKEIRSVLFVGHMIRTKGLFEMVEVASRFPLIEFTMAGAITKELNEIQAPLNMKFAGNLNKSMLKHEFAKADVFVFPTYTEGFSMALLEAMANGLPIITTNVGANHDMLETQGGILVSVGKANEICDALECINDQAMRYSMSTWNINKVRWNYTGNLVIGKIRSIYSSLIAQAH